MPFETPFRPRRIAVVGGGISGLGAAHFLAPDAQVVLFEAEQRLGGHARTVMAGRNGDQPVDTGFIVFNHVNYPLLTKLFRELDVPTAESCMSFGASLQGGRIEYGLKTLNALTAQRSNLLRPGFLRMVRDILRFNAGARQAASGTDLTVGGLIDRMRLGRWFRDYYLLPLSGAIWSTPCQAVLDFPAEAMIRFFDNHALLSHTGQHQWHTVRGGSVAYVRKLREALVEAGVELRTGAEVLGVRRQDDGVAVRTRGGDWEAFDEVVMATHSDDTLRLLDGTPEERAALSAIRYQPNTAVLHADTSVMPRRRACWSSWVYTEAEAKTDPRIDLTYWMNSLQPIPMDDPLFVTLNGTRPIRQELIHDEVSFRHPVYDRAALAAQRQVRALNGRDRVWFAGAWMRNGFHEDGLASAHHIAEALRARQARLAA